ncbi:MAG: YceI family protein [Pseudomonadota bacterium]
MMPTLFRACLFVWFAVMATAAQAADRTWVVDAAQSTIGFQYLRDGDAAEGVFSEFSGAGQFDPADPGKAVLSIMVETKSIDLYDGLVTAFATSAEWFDSKNHPKLIYTLHQLTQISGDRYEALGAIEIRGQVKVLRSEIVLQIGEAMAVAIGQLELDRTDYLLGVGPMAAFVEIGEKVAVDFQIVATPGT